MSSLTLIESELELKYCERCGALCLRLRGRDEVLCIRCQGYLQRLTARRALRRRA